MHFLASARIKATIGLGRRPDRTWEAWAASTKEEAWAASTKEGAWAASTKEEAWAASTKEAAWVASAGLVRCHLDYSKGGISKR